MINRSTTLNQPQATIQNIHPCVLHTTSTPSNQRTGLGSILSRVVLGLEPPQTSPPHHSLSEFTTATPLQHGPATPLSAEFVCLMDQIRLYMEAEVIQASPFCPLDFTLQDFQNLFDGVPRGEARTEVFRALEIWYRTIYIRHRYWEKMWRAEYEDDSPLPQQQEIAFFHNMRSGSAYNRDRFRDLFIHRNGGLVGWAAKFYRGLLPTVQDWDMRNQEKATELDMLLAAGQKGLAKAVDKFDPSRGYRFSTCAAPWIRGEITAMFKRMKSDLKRMAKMTTTLELGRSLRCDKDYLELSVAVGQGLARLNDPRKADIITRRYGLFGAQEADNLKSIAEPHRITPQRVHAILKASIAQLKKDQELRQFYNRWFYW